MAWTQAKNHEYAVGHHKVQLWELTADSATLALDTGLGVVDHITWSISSAASAPQTLARNVNTLGAAANGTVSVTGAASGDDIMLTVWGH